MYQKSSKEKETIIKKKIVEVSQQTSYCKKKIGVMKFVVLTSDLLARITLSLISSFAIAGCFQKIDFQGFNLVILNFELPSALLHALCDLFEK